MAQQDEKASSRLYEENASIVKEKFDNPGYVDNKIEISETKVLTSYTNFENEDEINESEILTTLDAKRLKSDQSNKVDDDEIQGLYINDIRIEFDNGLLFCEHCQAYYEDYCNECGMLAHILNRNSLDCTDNDEMPNDYLEIQHLFGRHGVFTLKLIPKSVIFGPFNGVNILGGKCKLIAGKFEIDNNKSMSLNWMKNINSTHSISEQNLQPFQCDGRLYYRCTRDIQVHEELMVYIGKENEGDIERNIEVLVLEQDVIKDVYACTFCCLGFSSSIHLVKHKTLCPNDKDSTFSIEELTQCPFCNINLSDAEYTEHHKAYCQKYARLNNSLVPETSSVDVGACKTNQSQVYKCKRCRYKTNLKSEFKNHRTRHRKLQVYNVRLCYKRLKTKKSIKAGTKNSEAQKPINDDSSKAVLTRENSKGSTKSGDKKKQLKCTHCEYRTKFESTLAKHMEHKHPEQINFECQVCEYKTKSQFDFDKHKTTHSLGNHECTLCTFKASYATNLRKHIENIHQQHKKYKHMCETCEYKTNIKARLDRHIKSQHRKEFDYKCSTCGFETNIKSNLEKHVKTKHTKEFDYKCEVCEFQTNQKYVLKLHVKSKHYKEFDYKCDKCPYANNKKACLIIHIKEKHRKEFDYKCESCAYVTNIKTDLQAHTKTKHHKEFDYACETCSFKTNNKSYLRIHIKTKHIKEFDYKCMICDEYQTNVKRRLKLHIDRQHLKKYQYRCNASETKTKCNL